MLAHLSPLETPVDALLLAGIDTFLMLLMPTPGLPLRALPPTALQGCLLSQRSSSFVSQNSIIYVPSFMTFDIFSYH